MSFSSLSTVCRSVSLACDGINLFDRLDKFASADRTENAGSIKASLTMRILLLGLNVIEVIAQVKGKSNADLARTKSVELLLGVINLPIKFVEAKQHESTTLGVIQEGVLIPLASLLRSLTEFDLLDEKAFLDLSPEERERARPIYEYLGNDEYEEPVIIGYRKIDEEESKKLIEGYEKSAVKLQMTEAVLKLGTAKLISNLYRRLIDRIYHHRPILLANPNNPLPNLHHGLIRNDDCFNLLTYASIPEELHQDVIFSKYICAINHCPVRVPVGDPNGRTLYEKSEIVSWLQHHDTSPVTREPLSVNQLVPKPAIQAVIDYRLHYHSERLRAFAQANINDPINQALQNSADQEHLE